MKNLFKVLFVSVIVSSFAIPALATENTTLDQLTPEVKAAEIQTLDEQEAARKKQFEDQLGISIPDYTNNPSYVVTFTDPSPDQTGVQIEIDNDRYIDIQSPYTLPALSIGQHHLSFKFTDKDGALQQLDYDISILPRPPIIKTPTFDADKISLSGTGLASSQILIYVSSNTNTYTNIANADSDGSWSIDIKPENGVENGIYTVVAYTRKYGYASDMSQAVVFQIGDSSNSILDTNQKTIAFSFSSINKDNIKDIVTNNTDLLILLGGVFLLGVILALILKALITGNKVDRSIKKAEESIKDIGKPKDKTLREMFEEEKREGKKKNETPKQEEKKDVQPEVKPESDSSVMTKEEFLKKFKMIDPDNSKGKENSSEKIKKEVKISLTSHEEE